MPDIPQIYHNHTALGAAMWQEIQTLRAEIKDLVAENKRLRVIIARSKADCLYCGLSSDQTAECESGFPGCRRIDDIVTSPEFLSGSTKIINYDAEELTPTVKYNFSSMTGSSQKT